MKVIILPSAKKNLKKLEKKVVEVILRKLSSIKDDPMRHINRLKSSRLWKLRIGDYRAILRVNTGRQEVQVVKIGHSRSIYK